MKILLSLIVLLLAVFVSHAQVTNLQVVAVIKLASGQSFTNSVTSSATNIFAAMTNSMTQLNAIRVTENKTAVTNLSQFVVEFMKNRFKQDLDEFDVKMAQDIPRVISVMTEADKNAIRNIIKQY